MRCRHAYWSFESVAVEGWRDIYFVELAERAKHATSAQFPLTRLTGKALSTGKKQSTPPQYLSPNVGAHQRQRCLQTTSAFSSANPVPYPHELQFMAEVLRLLRRLPQRLRGHFVQRFGVCQGSKGSRLLHLHTAVVHVVNTGLACVRVEGGTTTSATLLAPSLPLPPSLSLFLFLPRARSLSLPPTVIEEIILFIFIKFTIEFIYKMF